MSQFQILFFTDIIIKSVKLNLILNNRIIIKQREKIKFAAPGKSEIVFFIEEKKTCRAIVRLL